MQMKKEVQIIHIHSSITVYFTVLTTLTFTAVKCDKRSWKHFMFLCCQASSFFILSIEDAIACDIQKIQFVRVYTITAFSVSDNSFGTEYSKSKPNIFLFMGSNDHLRYAKSD